MRIVKMDKRKKSAKRFIVVCGLIGYYLLCGFDRAKVDIIFQSRKRVSLLFRSI